MFFRVLNIVRGFLWFMKELNYIVLLFLLFHTFDRLNKFVFEIEEFLWFCLRNFFGCWFRIFLISEEAANHFIVFICFWAETIKPFFVIGIFVRFRGRFFNWSFRDLFGAFLLNSCWSRLKYFHSVHCEIDMFLKA